MRNDKLEMRNDKWEILKDETWETEKMRGWRRKRKRASIMRKWGRLLWQALVVIMMSTGRNRGLKRGYNHNKNKEGFHKEYWKDEKKIQGRWKDRRLEIEEIEDWKDEEKKYTGRSFEGEKKN